METDVKEGLNFYQTYLSVIYGLLVGIGLEQLAFVVVSGDFSLSLMLLFSGTFISSVHFWMVCVASDSLSDEAYEVLEGGSRPGLFNMLFVLDVLFATAFAGCLLIMFNSAVVHYQAFFRFFLVLAGLSLAYDVCSLCVAAFASIRSEDLDRREKVKHYVQTYGSWLWLDVLFLGAAWGLFSLATHFYIRQPFLMGVAFFCISMIGMVLDVIIFHPLLYKRL